MKKGFAPILIVLAIAAIIAASFIFMIPQNITSTIRNRIFGLKGNDIVVDLNNVTPRTPTPQESLDSPPCDVNTDGKCNVADLDLLKQALGTSRGQKGYIPLADLDTDGVINEVDQQILLNLLSQNQIDTTANWKTYTSQDLTYSFKYPSNWNVKIGDGFVEISCVTPCGSLHNFGTFSTSKLIYKSINEFVEKSGYIYSDKRNAAINGQAAMQFVYPGSKQSGGSYLVWVVENRGSVYQLTYIYPKLLNAKNFNEFENSNPDIISTFKFL